jgi:exo-beta-1,3-glucanase (GH17 family)
MKMLLNSARALPFFTVSLLALGFVNCSNSDDPKTDPKAAAGAGGTDSTELIPETCPDGRDANAKRCIPDRVLARKGVAYSGYRAAHSPRAEIYPSEADIKEDLQLLIKGGWTFIRLFDSGTHAERTLKVISDNNFDIKVQLGVWVYGPKERADAANLKEIERTVNLATTYKSSVVAISVGNEVLDDWSDIRTPPADLVGYIQAVRERVEQPVTTDDMYPPFQLKGIYEDVLQVAQAVDYLSIHNYAILDASFATWEFSQAYRPEGERAAAMMDAAFEYTKANIRNVRAAMTEHGLDLPIIVGEAGWKSRYTKTTDQVEQFLAHPVNQKMFYDRLQSWVYGSGKDADSPRSAFYFEAFDEPWKGMDDGWGLFDVDRFAKYVIWEQFPERKPAGAPAYTDADAVHYK